MDIEKLKETLKANGVEDEKIDKILADLVEEDNEPDQDDKVEETQVEGNPEEDVPPAPTDDVPPEEVTEGNSEEQTIEEEVPPQEGDVPPVPPTEEEVAPSDVPPTDVPPVNVPPAPQFNPDELIARLDEAYSKIDELSKVIEGLDARSKSLEDALKNAGVLEPSENDTNIGVDGAVIPGSSSNGAESAFASALAKLNHK